MKLKDMLQGKCVKPTETIHIAQFLILKAPRMNNVTL
jgi:hypothetical protein